jgi:two-component system, NtrC family, sensor kinase
MATIAVILVVNSLLCWFSLQYVGQVWLEEIQTQVRLDLNSARAAYEDHVAVIASFMKAASLDRDFANALEENDLVGLDSLLGKVHRAGKMDFLCLVNSGGKVICRARNPRQTGDNLADNPLVAGAIARRTTVQGTVILTPDELVKEGDDLAARARFDLVETPAAWPTTDRVRADGMVLAAAVPIQDSAGRMLGVLYGGDLLSRRYEMVDAIKNDVFVRKSYRGREIGTVTIFQGDLRICTNVTLEDGTRAVGTRLSQPVADEVLVAGRSWAAPALVVDERYITAYEPIRDPTGRVVGALYVGLLQAPFLHRQHVITAVFLGLVSAATVGSLVLLFFTTKLVLSPIGRITQMSQKVIAGDLSARVAIRPSGEMGMLCEAIDAMAEAVTQREEQLKRLTQQQVGRSEKLASIGRLAAGVAHEINNPLTGVLTFAHLLREKENMNDEDREDLDLIIHETTRGAAIVRGLLDFARERPVVQAPLALNDVVRQTVLLLGNRSALQQIEVVEDLQEHLPAVNGDANQLQQVVVNLSVNACEAMPKGGTLLLRTSSEDGKVLVSVTDTGCGIKREHLDQIFEPFFSTKAVGKGTGLGLSVSYGIVQQHGGSLEVQSEEGKGSTFTVILPAMEV